MHKLLLIIFSFSFLIAAGGGGPVYQDSNSLLQMFKEFVNIFSEPIISSSPVLYCMRNNCILSDQSLYVVGP